MEAIDKKDRAPLAGGGALIDRPTGAGLSGSVAATTGGPRVYSEHHDFLRFFSFLLLRSQSHPAHQHPLPSLERNEVASDADAGMVHVGLGHCGWQSASARHSPLHLPASKSL